MNKRLGCVKSEIFKNEANFTEMIVCRFANCSHLRIDNQGFVKKNSNITCFWRSQRSLITDMNMWQGRIKGEIFKNDANFTEMIVCRFANCSHLRIDNQGFVKKNSNITCFWRSQRSLITDMNMWQGRWSTCTDDIARSSVLSLLNFNLFRSIQMLISRTQANCVCSVLYYWGKKSQK